MLDFNADAGTLTVIETPLPCWNSVTNDFDADPGAEAEYKLVIGIRELAVLSEGQIRVTPLA